MFRRILCALLSVGLLLLPLSGCAAFQNEVEEITDEEASPYYDLADRFLQELFEQDYTACYAFFAENLQNTKSADELQEEWEEVLLGVGDPVESDARKPYRVNGEYTVVLQITHVHGGSSLQLTFDENNGVAGLWFGTHDPEISYELDVPEGVTQRELVLGEGTDTPLRAYLTLPADPEEGEEIPAVVLVHDSGAYDANEALGNCTPFADIAFGLARRGIATLRYDKRTYTYASSYTEEEIQNMTVQEEVIEDAVRAAELLAETPGIDADSIVLVGHSLGGMLAPRIAASSGRYAALVSLAGSARDYLDVVYDQTLTLYDDASTQNAVKKEYKKVEKLDSMKDSKSLFGIPVPYLKDLYAHPVSESLASLDLPVLVLQGGRDFQISTEDYKSWQKALENYSGTYETVYYPELNHLFCSVSDNTRRGTTAEYLQAASVSEEVLDKLADFIASLS